MGIWSLGSNVLVGNWVGAAIDAGGVVIDVGATLVPCVPGGAGMAIKAGRYGDEVIDLVEGGVKQIDGFPAPKKAVENLPTVTFSSRTHPELAENIRHAQAAGHPSVLTHGGNAAANRAASLEEVPNILPLSRDEYPFATSLEGGAGSWVGHVPASQQNSQGGILSNFFRRNQIKPGDKYRVNTD
jgi:hypothetical protein